jgi:hypothetical protein
MKQRNKEREAKRLKEKKKNTSNEKPLKKKKF